MVVVVVVVVVAVVMVAVTLDLSKVIKTAMAYHQWTSISTGLVNLLS